MKKTFLALSLGAFLVASSSYTFAQQTIKVGHGAAETYHMHKAWVKFKDLVEKRSNGELTVEIYPNGQIGGDRELTEAVQSGIVDMTCPVVEVMDGWDPSFSISGLPFIFKDRANALENLNGEFGQALLKRVENFGIVGLGYMENGIRQITSNKCPIVLPEDLSGVKIRTMQVEAHMAFFGAMGANPTPMSFNEVYSALQQGVVDAEDNPLGHIYSSRFYEVQKCLTLTGHVYSTHMVLANPDFFYGLSEENQDLIRTALKESIDYQQEIIKQEENEQIKAIEDYGVTVTRLTPEQLSKWQEVTAPVREEYLKKADPELVKLLK